MSCTWWRAFGDSHLVFYMILRFNVASIWRFSITIIASLFLRKCSGVIVLDPCCFHHQHAEALFGQSITPEGELILHILARLTSVSSGISGNLRVADPLTACSELSYSTNNNNSIILAVRGECSFKGVACFFQIRACLTAVSALFRQNRVCAKSRSWCCYCDE